MSLKQGENLGSVSHRGEVNGEILREVPPGSRVRGWNSRESTEERRSRDENERENLPS